MTLREYIAKLQSIGTESVLPGLDAMDLPVVFMERNGDREIGYERRAENVQIETVQYYASDASTERNDLGCGICVTIGGLIEERKKQQP